MNHTKGGWHVGQGNGHGTIFADEGRMRLTDKGTTLYPICTMVRGWDKDEDEANARLVAAAPDLLDSVVALLEIIEGHEHEILAENLYADFLFKARAAIERATGGAA